MAISTAPVHSPCDASEEVSTVSGSSKEVEGVVPAADSAAASVVTAGDEKVSEVTVTGVGAVITSVPDVCDPAATAGAAGTSDVCAVIDAAGRRPTAVTPWAVAT